MTENNARTISIPQMNDNIRRRKRILAALHLICIIFTSIANATSIYHNYHRINSIRQRFESIEEYSMLTSDNPYMISSSIIDDYNVSE